jgi:hypothetical protein
MARNVRPAFAGSDHGGNVRFAGRGSIPSRRWPLPSPLAPWQMAQFAANMTPPACWAWRDASTPAGALGAPPSHPEMTSESVNRARAGCLRFANHAVAKGFHLLDNRRDKRIQSAVDGI